MKIRLEHNGTVFEFERKPIPECRFKALCVLAAAGVYAGMVWAVASLCDFPGLVLVLVLVGTVAGVLAAKDFF